MLADRNFLTRNDIMVKQVNGFLLYHAQRSDRIGAHIPDTDSLILPHAARDFEPCFFMQHPCHHMWVQEW
jgi:hypothetical protein